MMANQKLEITRQEGLYLLDQIDIFLVKEVNAGNKLQIFDLLAAKPLLQVRKKIWDKSYPVDPQKAKKTGFKISFTPEQILAVYATIRNQITDAPMPAVVAFGKFQQKALNYDQFVKL